MNEVHHDGLWFHPETPVAVRNVLAEAFHNCYSLRVWYGDAKTGVSWADEYDVKGRLGRSCGKVKVPLLVPVGEDGAPAMLDHCVIRIDRVHNNTKGSTLYVHPQFSAGTWTTGAAQTEGYLEGSYRDGELIAQFKKPGHAQAYGDFMTGVSYATPFH